MRDADRPGAERRLRAAVERLPRTLTPARDLWPEIAGRLAERSPGVPGAAGAGWWRLAAAGALMAAGLSVAVVLAPEERPGGPLVARAASAAGPAMSAARLRQRDGVLHAYGDLVAVAARRRGELAPAGAARLDAGLAELQRAVAEIESALADNPEDRRLRLALAAAYRRESRWIGRLTRARDSST